MKLTIGTREYELPDAAPGAPATIPKPTGPALKTRADAMAALKELEYFMGPLQRRCVIENFRGEERQYFYDLMCELAERVRTMPHSYQQDGAGEDAIAYLHYFAGGQANWWITEKDKGSADDGLDGNPPNEQQQAFGRADLFGDGGELGYISIAEILACNGELDFHFTPKTLRELRAETT